MFSGFKKIKKDKRGISLMEMVVAVAVFSVVIMMAMDLYFIAQKTQRKTTAIQKVQSDARYSLEAMAREIRVDKIDYDYYSDEIENPTTTLALLDEDNQSVIFKKMTDSGCSADLPCVGVKVGIGEWQRLTPQKIKVNTLNFYISPASSPFTENSTIDEQPRVTIVFASENVAARPEDQKSLILQTTVSSRYYGK